MRSNRFDVSIEGRSSSSTYPRRRAIAISVKSSLVDLNRQICYLITIPGLFQGLSSAGLFEYDKVYN